MEQNDDFKTRVQRFYNSLDSDMQKDFAAICPELKESDDERIRREIVGFLDRINKDSLEARRCIADRYGDAIPDDMIPTWIAWLEKQGEQASSQTNERAWLHLVSDVLTWKGGIGQYLDDPRVKELANKLRNEYAQKLYSSQNLANSEKTCKDEQKPVELSKEDKENFAWFDNFFRAESVIANGRDIPQDKYQWFKSLRPQDHWRPTEQKPAWSEEDEKMVGSIRGIIERYAFTQSAVDVNGDLCERKFIEPDEWLKSLKERYTWKPSKTQIDALESAIGALDAKDDGLVFLYNDLKKLKE